LQGRDNNADYASLVCVETGGTLIMNTGSHITGNAPSYGSGGGVIASGIFTMNGGKISGNITSDGGVVYVFGTFRISNGIIYGNTEANTSLKNTASSSGAALYVYSGDSAYGTFSGSTWNSKGNLSTTDSTIRVVNGVLQ
jgi:hypothetical protein